MLAFKLLYIFKKYNFKVKCVKLLNLCVNTNKNRGVQGNLREKRRRTWSLKAQIEEHKFNLHCSYSITRLAQTGS